jgi:hypothetical protein
MSSSDSVKDPGQKNASSIKLIVTDKFVSSSDVLTKEEIERQWEDYADSFNEPTKKDAWAKIGLWRLVGNGEQTNSECGKFLNFYGCVNAEGHDHTDMEGTNWDGLAYVKLKHKNCGNYNCPICYMTWAVKSAHRIANKLESLGPRFGVADHIVLSFPDGYFGPTDDFDKLLKEAVKALKARGVVGGVIIFHGFRYADKQEAIEKDVEFGWRWSSHIHVLGFIRNKKEFYKQVPIQFLKDGFVVKLKDKRKSVFGTAWYQLNHASIQFGKKHFEVARWFGDVTDPDTKIMRENSKKIKQLKKDSSEKAYHEIVKLTTENKDLKEKRETALSRIPKEKCPICGRELVKLEYHGLDKSLAKNLQQCSSIEDKRFFSPIIDSVNNCLNWVEA